MSALPTSWANCSLLECADFVRGVTYTKSDALGASNTGTIPILRANNIQAQAFDWNDLVYVPESLVSKGQELQVGDVVIATSSGSLSVVGKAAQVRSEIRASFGAFCGVLRPYPQIQARYYGHFFSSAHYRSAVSDLARGVNINNLKRDHFQAIQIPIAPLAEQKRIADKLDSILTRVDAVNTRLARVAPLLKRFRQSVLTAATLGRLTEDWRSAQKAADWMPRTVGSLCLQISDGPFGSNLKSDDYTEAGARVVRLENIGHLSFDNTKKTFIALGKYETLKKHTLNAGDLLFSSFVDEEVRVCEFPAGVVEPTINKADCFCVRVDETKVSRHFLMFWLACKSTYQELKELVHGATRPRINLGQLRGFELMLPPPDEQTEIVHRVEILFAFADRLEARLARAQTAATRLTPALLAKAFRGELVPQDPNDEPAAELLRRLQAQRATAAPASKTGAGRGRGRKAAATAD